jgi:transcriptional regulator with XRE-family HTH domain
MASKTGRSAPQSAAKPAAKNEALISAAMGRSGFTQFRALAQAAQVSDRQLRQLRRGQIAQLRLGTIQRVATVLGLDWHVLADSESNDIEPPMPPTDHQVQQEYRRLEQRLAQESARIQLEVQRSALTLLEPWLKNWPKVLQAVETSRPELPLAQVLGLLSPIDRLLESWDLHRIGAIGELIAFDPTLHVPIDGSPTIGDMVLIRRPGYRQGEVLLARAEVAVI